MIKRIIKYIDKKYLNGFISRAIPKTGFLSAKKLDKDPLSCNQFSDYFFDSSIKKQLEYVDPKGIITSDRLDVIVRYLFFKNLAYGKLSKEIESLYCRTILSRTGAIEPTDYYSPEEKIGIDSHIQSAKNLLDSIKENGFKQEYYIPIAKDYGLYNGAHRIAAGIALNQNVWIKYEGEHGVKNLDFEWFVDNGFSIEDQLRVLRGFADIYTNCGIFVLFGTCKSEWEYIIKRIGRSLHIVGSLDLDFSKDYLAFENLIHDIYLDYDNTSAIERKIELLKFAKLIVRVVVVSDEHHKSNDFYNDMVNIKTDIRNSLDSKYPANAFITLHGSDNREEFIHMKNILLSVNNLRCLGMRCKTNVRDEFLNWIVKYKQYCKNHGIDTNDACIIGSSPLEVMGIRNSTDIDIVISPELRKVYGDGIVHLTEELDIANRNYVKNEKNGEIYIFDEQLIYDDNYHFIFCGCKFANIELIHKRKSTSDREKDIKDVRFIDLFFECYKYFDDKKILQKQIEKELERRKHNN